MSLESQIQFLRKLRDEKIPHFMNQAEAPAWFDRSRSLSCIIESLQTLELLRDTLRTLVSSEDGR